MRKLSAAVLVLAAFVSISALVYGGDLPKSEVKLEGAQEVPPVSTDTSGRLKLRFNAASTEATFRLKVFEGVGVTQAHLHCALEGVNGPIVAFLFGFIPAGVNVNGLLAQGTLTDADILDTSGDPCGVTITDIASLLAAVEDGRVYANVHTLVNPAGEVRGQVE